MIQLLFESESPVCHCCATTSVRRFPFDNTAEAEGGEAAMQAEVTRQLRDRIDESRRLNKSIIVATTCSNQMIASRALRAAGFTSSKWADRPRPEDDHHGTKVRVWYRRIVKE